MTAPGIVDPANLEVVSELNDLESQQNDPTFANIWQELKWRGLVHVSTDEAELEKLLAGEPVTYYCGFDPTAPSLHLGNLVQLLPDIGEGGVVLLGFEIVEF